jgi:glycosyltransferase involved in cell wall biosynthesis
VKPGRSPTISVLMAVYNGERFLAAAIESVLAQSFSDFELVIVDDGSTDSSADILAGYAERDPRVVLHRQSNQGAPTALNAGAKLARAPLIARLDADDVALPVRLEVQHRRFCSDAALAMVGGQVIVVDEHDRAIAEAAYPLSDAEIRREFAKTTPFVHSAVTMRKEIFERAGGYRPSFDLAEDLDLWLRIAEHGEVANLDSAVVRYRIHENQVSARKLELQAIRSLAARTGARKRAGGEADPFDADLLIDEELLLAQGIAPTEIDAAIVEAATWLAKTLDRAGYRQPARGLFDLAAARARSSADSATLTALVQRAIAIRHAERGHPVRAKLGHFRAALTESAPPGFRR